MYFLMPETENCTLEDIELHFSDNNRKLTDITIRKAADKVNQIKMAQIQNGKMPAVIYPSPNEVIEINAKTPSVVLDMVMPSDGKIDSRKDGVENKAFTGDDKVQ